MGGDHKCPLCSATFTRPQHVGRHLRAHTGDRPYECKQCPLKFARSDLLSRHVNKAHPKPPDEDGQEKRADGEKKAKGKSRGDERPLPAAGPSSARSSLDHGAQVFAAHQQQQSYPQHQMLPLHPALAAQPQQYMYNPVPMQVSQSDSGVHPSLVRPPSQQTVLASATQQQAVPPKQEKARACDQCNHSKVKCDSGRPCAKCIHRSMACTYDKPSKNRSSNQHQPTHAELDRRRNSYTAPDSASSYHHMQQSPAQAQGYYPSPPGMYPSPPYVNYAPQTHQVAPTPALTHTSPAGSDDYPDTQRSFVPVLGPSPEGVEWTHDNPKSAGSTYQHASPQYALHNYSPVTTNLDPTYLGALQTQIMPDGTSMDPSSLYQWPPGSQPSGLDPRFQMQSTSVFTSDDEEASMAASNSTQSSFIDLPDLANANGSHGPPSRRPSTGVWQNAFDQMSLQDRMAAAVNEQGEALFNREYERLLAAQETAPQRPTFPTFTYLGGEGEQRMPSLSDTKDLWKMFMTDPSAVPSVLQSDDLQTVLTPTGIPIPTPRPGMGRRTLSKSNSMPDLNSPLANPALFSSFFNGNTPRAGPHPPPEGAADPATVRKWSQELQARQVTFKMQLETVGRKPSSPLNPGTDAMPPPERPLPSVRQGASLQQTLAPERTPSFSLTPQAWSDTSGSFSSYPATPHSHHRVQSMSSAALTPTKMGHSLSGVPPAYARPGNKRLPSQTLMPDTQKRASFNVFDEDEDQSTADDYTAGPDKVARHQAVGAPGAGQHAPSFAHSPLMQQQSSMVIAAQTWATWPPLTAGQAQMAGLDDLRKGV